MITETVSGHRGWVDVRFGSRGHQSQSGESHEHAENQTQDEMEREGGPQLPSFRQGWAGVFIHRVKVWVTIYTMQRKWEVGEREEEMSKLGPAHDRHTALYAKGSLVNNKRGGNE